MAQVFCTEEFKITSS